MFEKLNALAQRMDELEARLSEPGLYDDPDRAAKLLEETDLRIYEVCQMVGYSDVNHFNQLFERLRGMKPNEYRKKCRNE